MTIRLPPTSDFRSVALGASEYLRLHDRVRILGATGGFAPLANAGTVLTDVGSESQTGGITSVARVDLHALARVNGDVISAADVTQGSAVVTGTILTHQRISVEPASWTVAFPAAGQAVTVYPAQTRALAPGSYGSVTVHPNARLSLRSGTYFMDVLDVQSFGTLAYDTTAGPIFLYLRTTLTFRGVIRVTGPADRVLIADAGALPVFVGANLGATLIAPQAPVRLGQAGTIHYGAVFAKTLEVDPDVRFTHRTFAGWDQLAFHVVPTAHCVESRINPPAVLLGYWNPNRQPVTRPVGSANRFIPAPQDHGQPTTFLPGRFATTFSVDRTGSLSWVLDGQTLALPADLPACPAAAEFTAAQDTMVTVESPAANFGEADQLTVGSDRHLLVEFDRTHIKKLVGAGRFAVSARLEVFAAGGGQPAVEALVMSRRWTEPGATWNCANDADRDDATEACGAADGWNLQREDLNSQNPWTRRDPEERVLGAWTLDKVSFDVTRDVWDLLGSDGIRKGLSWVVLLAPEASGSGLFHSRESSLKPRLVLQVAPRPERDPGGTAPLGVAVDAAVVSRQPPLPPLEDGVPRPLAALKSPDGIQADFVERELLVLVRSEAELAQLVSRWNAVVLTRITSPHPILAAAGTSVLLRIDPGRADRGAFLPRMLEIDNRVRGLHRFSSVNGLATMAAAAEEVLAGRRVALNWMLQDNQVSLQNLLDRRLTEGPDKNTPQPGIPVPGTNPFRWPGFTRCGPDPASPEIPPPCTANRFPDGTPIFQILEVAEAWRALVLAGAGAPASIPVTIVDLGFDARAADYPPFAVTGQTEASDCAASMLEDHGHFMTMAGFGVPDNGTGAAGPGGLVANLNLRCTRHGWGNMDLALVEAMLLGTRIVSISRSGVVPVFSTPFSGTNFTGPVRDAGVLIFSSAGNGADNNVPNDGMDVDEETCIDLGPLGRICWESSSVVPCENDGVICVSGLGFNSELRHPDSNFGKGDVDIAGPYTVYVGDAPTVPVADGGFALDMFGGTSSATAFAAGVASLVWSADPQASADRVERCLFAGTSRSQDGEFTRSPNALKSIQCMLAGRPGGNIPPHVRIELPEDGLVVNVGQFVSVRAVATDPELGTLQVGWFSDRDGFVGTSGSGQTGFVAFRTPGPHRLTARVSDGQSTAEDSVAVNVEAQPRPVRITSPAGTQPTFSVDLTVPFVAQTGGIPPPASAFTWTITRDGVTVFTATGPGVQHRFTATGVYRAEVVLVDPLTGLSSSDSRNVTIIPSAGTFLVNITAPPVAATGLIEVEHDQPVTLGAESNRAGATFEWFVEFDSVQSAGSGQTRSWDPRSVLPASCFERVGTLSVVARDGGSEATDARPIRVRASVAELQDLECIR